MRIPGRPKMPKKILVEVTNASKRQQRRAIKKILENRKVEQSTQDCQRKHRKRDSKKLKTDKDT